MNSGNISPIICFGQQPNGFFPKGFFVDKILTARELQKQTGGKIVWFCHDSDHDYRETVTTIKTDRYPEGFVRFNINQPSKFEKLFTPLYLKRIKDGWQEETARKLEPIIPKESWELFRSIQTVHHRHSEGLTEESPTNVGSAYAGDPSATLRSVQEDRTVDTVSDFCLALYRGMGLLEGIEIMRSSDTHFRTQASDLSNEDHYLDIEYKGSVVHARKSFTVPPPKKGEDGGGGVVYFINHGGDVKEHIPPDLIPSPLPHEKLSPTRETRFAWMQSVVHCTHYIYGRGEKEYVDFSPWRDIQFIERNQSLEPDFAVSHFDLLHHNS